MSAAKFAERLIILCDHALGVQARLYSLVDYKRPALFAKDSEIEKFARLFLRKFPEFPDVLQKEKGADVFKQRAPEITAALQDFYYTFMEVINFTDESWKLLTELGTNMQEFKLDHNVDILTYFFTLLTRYVQIHMLVHLIDTPQLFLASYARAFHHTSGNTEPHFSRIARYLGTFKPTPTTSPLKRIQDDAQALSLLVGNTLIAFLPILQRYSSVQGYMSGKLFNILQEEPKNLTWGANERIQIEATHLANMRNWVLWGFLVCPAELGRPGALDLLSMCLRETFLLQIYRDKCLSIHKEFDDLMDYKSANGAFKLAKHKKVFRDASADDEGTRKFHLDLRTYLLTEAEQFDLFFADCPSVLPAKLQMVVALLSLARNEVLWFFRHQHFVPYRCSSSKIKGLPWDPQVVDLIHLVQKLQRLIEQNRKEIQAHYVEWLTGDDATKARALADTFLTAVQNPAALSALVHAVVDHLHERQAGENLESIRLNWYRISATLTHAHSGVPMHAAGPFTAIMNRVVMHSRNIDLIDAQLKAQASFGQLFWYKADVAEALNQTLRSVDGRAQNCMSLVSWLNSSLHNVHRLAPDEQPTIGREIMLGADSFIKSIVHAACSAIQTISAEAAALRARTNHKAVIERIGHAAQMALNPTGVLPLPQPGDESLYGNRRAVQNSAAHHKILSDICASISIHDVLVIYNHEFVAREYLYESLSNLLRGSILNLCVAGPAIQKPTMILSRLKDTIYALSHVERAMSLNTADIVRDVLLSELSPSPEEIQALHASEHDPNKPVPIIWHVASFYSTMFAQDLAAQQGIVYSPLRKCFISRKGQAVATGVAAQGQNAAALEFERFTDVSELRALCTLIGPAGVSVIERGLLKLVFRFAKVVKDVLLSNQTVLLNLSNRFTEQSVWLDNIGILSNMDPLCSALASIGCILHFRLLLRSALQSVVKQHSPFVHQAVALAHRAVHDAGVVVEPKLAVLDGLASDVGLDVGEADHPLRQVLAPLKTTVADNNMFGFLPELFGLMFLSQRWRTAQFSIELEGHTNNNHTIALAVRQLLVQFARLHVKESPPPAEVERRISADLGRFVRCSAFTMTHLKVLNAREANNPAAHFPLPHIMIFLEHCVKACAGRVENSVLEQCFPFTMLRTNAIQVYEKQTNVHANAPVADEADGH